MEVDIIGDLATWGVKNIEDLKAPRTHASDELKHPSINCLILNPIPPTPKECGCLSLDQFNKFIYQSREFAHYNNYDILGVLKLEVDSLFSHFLNIKLHDLFLSLESLF